jgi:hypothetical protein
VPLARARLPRSRWMRGAVVCALRPAAGMNYKDKQKVYITQCYAYIAASDVTAALSLARHLPRLYGGSDVA